jgi:bisphosphoglycerate-dependent phosphoglycerate mutase
MQLVHGVARQCDWTMSARLHIWVLLSLFHRGESGAARAGSIILKAREQRFAVATLAFNSRASSKLVSASTTLNRQSQPAFLLTCAVCTTDTTLSIFTLFLRPPTEL